MVIVPIRISLASGTCWTWPSHGAPASGLPLPVPLTCHYPVSWPRSSFSKVLSSGYCVGSLITRITLSKTFLDPRIDETPQVPLHWGQPSNSPKNPLRGAVLLILQMGKLRLKKLSWHLNPSRSPWSPCSPPSVRVCVCTCAHTAGSAVCCLNQAVFGLG